MGKVGTGISIRDVKNRSILLKDNIIEAEKTGILLNQCVPRVGDVINNTIKIDGDGDLSVGIELNNPPMPLFWKIEDNPITLHEAVSGIYNSAGKDVKILNNTITLGEAEEDDRNGISLDGTEHSIVKCNVVNGDIELEGPNYHLGRGIDLYFTTNFDVSCNIVQDLRDGIFISSQNSKCLLRANSINNNFVGLHMGSDAAIGEQYFQNNQVITQGYGNLWEEDSYDWAAKHEGALNMVFLSPFIYNELVNSDSKPFPVSAAGAWFTQVPVSLYSCQVNSVCPDGYGSGNDFASWDSLDYKLVAGNLGFSHYDNCLSWMGRFQTYKRLHTATSTSGWPSSITTFLSNQASLNIGKFSNAFDSLNHSLYYVGGYEQVLDDFRDSIISIFTRIHYLDSLLLEDRFNSTISDLITEEYEAIFLYECEFKETDSLINILLQDRLDNAISYTESISPDSIWQEALKFSLLEFLNYAKDTTLLSPEDLADLASSCPDKYGEPVFYARSLLNTDSEKIAYDDYALCSFATPRTSESGTTTFNRIFPNPASSMIELEVSGEISNISFYSIDGKFAPLSFSIADNKANANTSSLASGIYLAKVMYLDGRIETLKFIVSH